MQDRLRQVACATVFMLLAGVAQAAQPAPSSIVLQLPSSMTAGEVTQLVEGLRARGATTTAAPGPLQPAAEPPLVQRVIGRLRQAASAAPELLALPVQWNDALARESHAAPGFWPILAAVLLGAFFIEFSIRRGAATLIPSLRIRPEQVLPQAFAAHALCLALGVAGFLLVVHVGTGLLGAGSALLAETSDQVAAAAGDWRIAMAILTLLAAPGLPAARPLPLDEPGAYKIVHWISGYLLLVMVLVVALWLTRRLGDDETAVAMGFGLALFALAYKIVMFIRLRAPVSAGILVAGGEAPGWPRRLAALSWHLVFIALSVAIFLLAVEQYTVGNNPRAAIAATASQSAIVGMALVWAAKRRFIFDYRRSALPLWWRPTASRTVDILILFGGLAWLAGIWGYGLLDAEAGSLAATLLRPLFKAAATLAAAWLIWSAISGFLGERMPQRAPLGEDPTLAATAVTRLATLLPLIRNTLAIAIFFLGAMIALGDLGVDIGPLLAGAGVVGIALGFGAQALVRDVIAGLFFLVDDAFRLGEYIDTGRLKGTVEAISIRSLRLRHQNGQIHTIPFGQILAVTNSSRDWTIVKFNLHVAPTTDLALVGKTVKQLGQSLLGDPEIGADFIQPLKMQGVLDVTQGAIMIQCKFTALPVRPAQLQRRALHEIIERFAAAGIAFAPPPANASNPR